VPATARPAGPHANRRPSRRNQRGVQAQQRVPTVRMGEQQAFGEQRPEHGGEREHEHGVRRAGREAQLPAAEHGRHAVRRFAGGWGEKPLHLA